MQYPPGEHSEGNEDKTRAKQRGVAKRNKEVGSQEHVVDTKKTKQCVKTQDNQNKTLNKDSTDKAARAEP